MFYRKSVVMEKFELVGKVVNAPDHMLARMENAPRPDMVERVNGVVADYKAPVVWVDLDGVAWWCGVRPLVQCRVKGGLLNGWACVGGKRRRFVETELECKTGVLKLWLCDQSRFGRGELFKLPFPLQTHEDARRWEAAGFSLRLTEKQWLSLLGWPEIEKRSAVLAAVRERWRWLASTKDHVVKPWPHTLGDLIHEPSPVDAMAKDLSFRDVCERLVKTEERARVAEERAAKAEAQAERFLERLSRVERAQVARMEDLARQIQLITVDMV